MKDCSTFIFRVKQSQKNSCVGRYGCIGVGLHLNCNLYSKCLACFTHPCQYIKAPLSASACHPNFLFTNPIVQTGIIYPPVPTWLVFLHSLILKMVAVQSFKILVIIYPKTQYNIPKDFNLLRCSEYSVICHGIITYSPRMKMTYSQSYFSSKIDIHIKCKTFL